MKIDAAELGAQIRAARRARRMSEQDLARLLHTTQSVVSDLETGKNRTLPMDQVLTCCELLGVSLLRFLGEDFRRVLIGQDPIARPSPHLTAPARRRVGSAPWYGGSRGPHLRRRDVGRPFPTRLGAATASAPGYQAQSDSQEGYLIELRLALGSQANRGREAPREDFEDKGWDVAEDPLGRSGAALPLVPATPSKELGVVLLEESKRGKAKSLLNRYEAYRVAFSFMGGVYCFFPWMNEFERSAAVAFSVFFVTVLTHHLRTEKARVIFCP